MAPRAGHQVHRRLARRVVRAVDVMERLADYPAGSGAVVLGAAYGQERRSI